MPVMDETQIVNSFKYTHLQDVDPTIKFTPVDEGFYNLRVISAKRREYQRSEEKGGGTGEFIVFRFAVQDSPKFMGRKVNSDPLFFSSFSQRILRKIQDASGIQQSDEMELDTWLQALETVGPTLKLKVTNLPDVNYTGVPNTRNPGYNAETGDPGQKTVVDWNGGIQPGD